MHIGYIMDGNRRWDKKQGINLISQHKKGFENISNVLLASIKHGADTASFWGLAYKNLLERSQPELTQIYTLIESGFENMEEMLTSHDIRVVFVGDHGLLPESTKASMQRLVDATKNHTAITCVFAIGYGGRRELVTAIQKILADNIDPKTITEEVISTYIETAQYPAPDIIVRTGCSHRLRHSGYFLWQSEYSEYYFSEKYWPELDETDVIDIVKTLSTSERNFGK